HVKQLRADYALLDSSRDSRNFFRESVRQESRPDRETHGIARGSVAYHQARLMTGDEFLSAIAASLPVTWQDWALLIAAVVAALGIIGWVINLVNERQSASGNRAHDLRLNLPEEKPDPDLEESEYMPLRAALRRLYAEPS